MNHSNLFSKSKSHPSLYGIGFLILIGITCLIKSSEGLSCFHCSYTSGATGNSSKCLDPVKSGLTPETRPDNLGKDGDPLVCLKSTITYPGPPEKKILTRYFGSLSTAKAEGVDFAGKGVKCITNTACGGKEFTCYCNTPDCNDQSGVDTTGASVVLRKAGDSKSKGKSADEAGVAVALEVFSANIVFLGSVPLKYFMDHIMM